MQKFDVGCYYFPNYHCNDGRNAQVHGPGWSEWELVKAHDNEVIIDAFEAGQLSPSVFRRYQ